MKYEDMKIDDIVKKINELYKKSKEEGLNDEEKEVQDKLRKIYINNVKNNFRVQLQGIKPKDSAKSKN